jgi:pSer/pThr/pTyr-binding forkhead associated (FHA) protein
VFSREALVGIEETPEPSGGDAMSVDLVLVPLDPRMTIPSFRLAEGRFVLGRMPDCDFVSNDPTVARHRAEITVTNGVVTIRDLKSPCGIWVNSRQIRGEQLVDLGALIRIGTASYVLRAQQDPGRDVEFTCGSDERGKS